MTTCTVDRAVVRTTSDGATLARALRAATLEPRGLDRHTTFAVRCLPDPAPGLLRADPRAWEHRVVDVLSDLLATAARPAHDQGVVPGGCLAVRFDGPGERLADLLLAAAVPQGPTWWREPTGWSTASVADQCVRHATDVPHAFAWLHSTGRLDDVVGAVSEAEAEAVFGALTATWSLPATTAVAEPHEPDMGDGPTGAAPPLGAPPSATADPRSAPSARRRLVGLAATLAACSPSARTARDGDGATNRPRPGPWAPHRPESARSDPARPAPSAAMAAAPPRHDVLVAQQPTFAGSATAPARLSSAYAGAFMVLNAFIVLGVAHDFTQPRECDDDLDPFGLLRAVVERVLGADLAAVPDPIATLLAPLADDPADRARATTIGRTVTEVVGWLDDAVGPDLDASAVVRRAGAIEVVDNRLDVVLPLDDLPIEVRLAGLDRDLGWLPAAGCYVAFHFPSDELTLADHTAVLIDRGSDDG